MKLTLLCEATYYNKDRLEVVLKLPMPVKARYIRYVVGNVHALVNRRFASVIVDLKSDLQNWETRTSGANLTYTRYYPISRPINVNVDLGRLAIRALRPRVREPAAV